jgi:hypothetical protein
MKRTFLIPLTVLWLTISTHGQNPVIQSVIGQVCSDSIQRTLQHLQFFGTRYCLADNRKEIATWIMNKFSSYGYADVKLDSFEVTHDDSLYKQYNVVCTLHGARTPGEVCVIGGHYDSYCSPDPDSIAPGVDDNGSAVAATLEAARVLKLLNYQPESTIRFILFAGEELGYWGSKYQAGKSKEAYEDIRLMMNMDMIAYNPDSTDSVYVFKYKGAESAYYQAKRAFHLYTGLSVADGPFEFQHRSDSYPYWQFGYQATWAFEYFFNDFYHTADDVVSNCNIGYCAEIAQGTIATIMEMQFLPFPQGIVAESSRESITISWKPTENNNLKGYKLYRSENHTAGFVQLNSAMITDTFYIDLTVETTKDYYYFVTLINNSLEESVASGTVHGVKFGFTDTLLVVTCMKDTQTTPDSIVQFYNSVLDSIPFRWFDMNKDHPLTLATLSQYRNTLWIINSLEYDKITDQAAGDLETFFDNHGNMMFAGFSFCRFMLGNIGFPSKVPEGSPVRNYFRIDSVSKKINSLMYRAYPDKEVFDTLHVDIHKSFKPGYPGELYNIEVFSPAPGGNPIYRFDSKYDPGTQQGSQQDKIIGLEYMGDDYKTLLLSFPLYYIDTADARRLMNYVVKNKFTWPTGVPLITDYGLRITNYPNPVIQSTTFSYALKEPGQVSIQIFNSFGQLVAEPFNASQLKGEQKVTWNAGNLPEGIYFYRIQVGKEAGGGKMIKW